MQKMPIRENFRDKEDDPASSHKIRDGVRVAR